MHHFEIMLNKNFKILKKFLPEYISEKLILFDFYVCDT